MRWFPSSPLLCTALLCAGLVWPAAAAPATRAAPAAPTAPHEQAVSAAEYWLPPLGYTLTLERPFQAPANRYSAGHRGFDLPATSGDWVSAPVSGTVTFSGRVVDREVVSVRVNPQTVVSFEPVSSELAAGDTVDRGALLGVVTSGGHCATECLHLGVRVDDWYVNPMRYFRGKPRLLPWD
ncbi:murein DD-endopeptidase MepM/ murein hydrolase activator NlpD [Leucobacter exalbidus]|uniref:Murein DD-endopeptidase MepM/ murein hydrolase activator NlpD n=1 Tax=Leucobacter exalbidus TaxID=662960 RepID=A0A940PPY6_9MICO|nr:M23 family metallopeptidase [Leucobacter exalbidus]MBP1325459.1 murein DD-endopeptidase MepM/ murein hydrolase activator NlpD [Leucobacter exalbidus]